MFVSANKTETGFTLAQVDSNVMQAMKNDKIFIGIGVKDYQAKNSSFQQKPESPFRQHVLKCKQSRLKTKTE